MRRGQSFYERSSLHSQSGSRLETLWRESTDLTIPLRRSIAVGGPCFEVEVVVTVATGLLEARRVPEVDIGVLTEEAIAQINTPKQLPMCPMVVSPLLKSLLIRKASTEYYYIHWLI